MSGRMMAVLTWLALSFGAWLVQAPLMAQELPLRPDLGSRGVPDCRDQEQVPSPDPEARDQALQLAGTADQALILGDLLRARALLDRAVELDRSSPELAYRRARVLEDLGEVTEAVSEYCRVLAIANDEEGFGDARERRERIAGAGPEGVPEEALVAARRGVTAAERGDFDAAVRALGAAVEQAPTWADAAYNRGVALAHVGRSGEAAAELRRYLELAPSAPDAVAVSRRIGQLETLTSARAPSPGTALTLGMLFPGMGQFYSGRTPAGIAVLALAGGAVAGGLLVTEVHVRCLVSVEPGQRCPTDQVVERREERPYLAPALGLAAGIAMFGAIEALVRAKRPAGGDEEPLARSESSRLRLEGPSLRSRGGRIDLSFVRVRFR